MRVKLILLLLICAMADLAFGQKKAFKPTHYEHSLLWQISGKGLKQPSYLFGTYHLASKSLVDSLPIIRQRFESCTMVAGEIVMDSTALQKLAGVMIMTDNSLDKMFAPAQYKLIADRVKAVTGMDMSLLNQIRPAALQMMLVQSNAAKTATANMSEQLDTYFQVQEKKRNGKVVGLETIDDQIGHLFNKDIEVEKKRLIRYVSKPDTNKATLTKMYQLYLKQDLNGLYKLMMEDDNDGEYTQQEKDGLFKDRNMKWMTELPGLMSERPTFIVVGAAHLLGPDGLIDQLRSKGYTVTAVMK